jgi:hypothetical protein
MNIRMFYFLSVMVLFINCSTKRQINSSNDTDIQDSLPGLVKTTGTLQDLSGMDGCNWMILTEDDVRIHPVSWPDGVKDLLDGMKISFVYREVTDVVTICMAGDLTADILEITNVTGKDIHCEEIKDPYMVPWMAEIVEKETIYSITRYKKDDGYLFYFQAGQKNYLYSCDGKFICDVTGRIMNPCAEMIASLDEGVVIWVTNY